MPTARPAAAAVAAAAPAGGGEFSDPVPVGHVLFLPPNFETTLRLLGELAAAGVCTEQTRRRGLRVPVGEADWRTILEAAGTAIPEAQRAQTRVALVPRGADDLAERRAVLAARTLAQILGGYADAWLGTLLQNNALRVHLQPLVQYPPGQVYGYECLVRGVGPDRRLIGPARLFAAAARTDMTYLLDRHACRAAVATAAGLGFANLQFFINVLADAIDDPVVHARSTRAAVDAGGLRPGQVTFEVAQAEGCRDRAQLGGFVRACRDAGFAVSLDDVGAGGASLLSLDDLRPDCVKLDAELCRSAPKDRAAAELFRGLADAARRRGIMTIAKGIETEEQLRFAIDAGVPVTQGYIHAKPAPTPLDADDEDQVLRQVRRTAILAAD